MLKTIVLAFVAPKPTPYPPYVCVCNVVPKTTPSVGPTSGEIKCSERWNEFNLSATIPAYEYQMVQKQASSRATAIIHV